eukprot:CAMPEP_0184679730 /NCGR_PEP_ID=MMETSP0312-20130426/2582_1 /TAXON_ID=31354 /ORGANISM="Compsopogon coeruleus, Strain SAG 36.94" /LENGTH=387 /DNA_ID=CAMNT_0027129361 /DNA_START=3258 /DNA_END=4423 /DNA_ORIENTATION=+
MRSVSSRTAASACKEKVLVGRWGKGPSLPTDPCLCVQPALLPAGFQPHQGEDGKIAHIYRAAQDQSADGLIFHTIQIALRDTSGGIGRALESCRENGVAQAGEHAAIRVIQDTRNRKLVPECVDPWVLALRFIIWGKRGAAVAYAGRKLGIEVIVVVPATTPEFMRAKIEAEGAHVRVHGDVWDEADLLAKEIVDGDPHACYISPFDHPDIWEGHATMIEEVQAQLAEVGSAPPSAVALSVGGGGLLLGACVGMQRCGWDAVPILAAETEGAASLSATVAAGRIVALPSITSVAKSLGARQVSTECLRWLRTRPIVARTVTDHQAVKACQEFATHHRYLVEPACGAAIALAYLPDRLPSGSAPLVVVVCGGNIISPTILDDLVHQVG